MGSYRARVLGRIKETYLVDNKHKVCSKEMRIIT